MVQVLSRDGIQRMVRKGGVSSAAGGAGGGGGLTSAALAQLTDVELGDTISDMDALVYSGSLSKWTNVSIAYMATKTWVGNNYLALTGGTVTGDVQILQIKIHHTNEINNQSGLLHLQYRGNYGLTLCNNGEKTTVGGAMEIAGNVSMADGGRINIKNEPSGSALYIGNSNNAGWVRLSDMCSKDGTAGDTYWSIRTSGNAVFANVLSNGYVTALSDIRKKDVVGDFDLRVADIAGASLIRFTWKDGHDADIHVGGIAQEWKRLLPEAVREDADGTLSMDYGVIAVAASVSIARKVVAQERVINAQGKKIAELEKRIARLEKMFAIDINDIEEE